MNTVPEGVKIRLLGIKGLYNIFSEHIFLEDMKLCTSVSNSTLPTELPTEYSHNTVIPAVASSDPRLFCTLHLYTAPLSPLVRFVKVRVSDEESAMLFPCLVQVMLGCGLPVALQNRVTTFPSTIC